VEKEKALTGPWGYRPKERQREEKARGGAERGGGRKGSEQGREKKTWKKKNVDSEKKRGANQCG
jgi:hypothetical protein